MQNESNQMRLRYKQFEFSMTGKYGITLAVVAFVVITGVNLWWWR